MKVRPPFFSKVFISCTTGVFLLGTYAHHLSSVRSGHIRTEAEQEVLRVLQDVPSSAQGECYLFLRLYNPVYNNSFSTTNFLRYCISKTDVTDYHVSHASVGFSLGDSFFGLTQTGASCVKVEHCTDNATNPYMSTCDVSRSTQITFAVQVTPREYEAAMQLIASSGDLSYSVMQNFLIAQYCVERKYLTEESNRSLDVFYRLYAPKSQNEGKKERFVCSTFVAHVLDSSVSRIHDFFEEREIDYHFLTVADLAEIPGVTPLFSSSWEDYSIAARQFADENPEFAVYL